MNELIPILFAFLIGCMYYRFYFFQTTLKTMNELIPILFAFVIVCMYFRFYFLFLNNIENNEMN